jgi:uncharacterized membrane protein
MKQNVRRLTTAALGAALVCIATSLLKFPIPLGYAHLGNCMILLFGVFFDPWIGACAGGIGSALSDLLGYPEWVLPTLIIKTLMGLAVALISKKPGQQAKLRSMRTFIAVIVGIVIMVLGYFIGGSILYGSIITGATQIPGLATEGVVGILLFYVIGGALEAAGVTKKLQVMTA